MKNLALSIILGLWLMNNATAAEPDWTEYAKVLQFVSSGEKHSVPVALVDYAALKKSGLLEPVYQNISAFPVKSLSSNNEKLAFYINTYNILALKMVLDHWPLDSIKDVGYFLSPVWGKEAGFIDGESVSLDDIENRKIRTLGEARIHFAIVCASVSCPDLRNEPYTANKLHQQLNEQVQIFLGNDKKGLLLANNKIEVSKIFKWFQDDFNKAGGVEAFIRRYRSDLPVLAKFSGYIDYDWSVNALSK